MLPTLVLVFSLLYGAHCTAPSMTVKTVTCTAKGFTPSFTWNLGTTTTTQTISIDWELGGSSKDWCKVSKPATLSSTNADTTIASADFDGTLYANGYIPYLQDSTNGAESGSDVRCGGIFSHYTDNADSKEKIKYEVTMTATVTRKHRTTVLRKTKYPFKILCKVEREVTDSSAQGFTVATALVQETEVEVPDDFEFYATMNLYDSTYNTGKAAAHEAKNNEDIYAMVVQDADQDLFKFAVDECTATIGQTLPQNDAAKKDTFLSGQCPLDSTVQITPWTLKQFKMQMKAFTFNGVTGAIFLHCKLKVCLASSTAPECTQKTAQECVTANTVVDRRRRAIGEDEGVLGTTIVTSKTSILFDRSEVFAPRCGNAFIYDRVLQECSNENLLEIRGVYLGGAAWDPAYANVTSEAFKSMAATREYQLWVLLQVTRRSTHIHGVKVIRAREGSVILDVVVKYSSSLSAEQAFQQFEGALHTKPSVTRVMNLLQIREGTTVEFVPIVAATQETDTEKLILIVVVVVLFVVVFIAGVTLFKVRQVRQRSANNNNGAPAAGFDNKGIDA